VLKIFNLPTGHDGISSIAIKLNGEDEKEESSRTEMTDEA
jgi:hypothetical protein